MLPSWLLRAFGLKALSSSGELLDVDVSDILKDFIGVGSIMAFALYVKLSLKGHLERLIRWTRSIDVEGYAVLDHLLAEQLKG